MQTRSSQNGFIRVFLFDMTFFFPSDSVSHNTEEMIIIIRTAEQDSVSVQFIRQVDFIQKKVIHISEEK